jgi:hypothetical protein
VRYAVDRYHQIGAVRTSFLISPPAAVRGYIRIGDGKIFIANLDKVIRICAEERGGDAL